MSHVPVQLRLFSPMFRPVRTIKFSFIYSFIVMQVESSQHRVYIPFFLTRIVWCCCSTTKESFCTRLGRGSFYMHFVIWEGTSVYKTGTLKQIGCKWDQFFFILFILFFSPWWILVLWWGFYNKIPQTKKKSFNVEIWFCKMIPCNWMHSKLVVSDRLHVLIENQWTEGEGGGRRKGTLSVCVFIFSFVFGVCLYSGRLRGGLRANICVDTPNRLWVVLKTTWVFYRNGSVSRSTVPQKAKCHNVEQFHISPGTGVLAL